MPPGLAIGRGIPIPWFELNGLLPLRGAPEVGGLGAAAPAALGLGALSAG